MKSLQFANGDRLPILGLGTWKSEPGEVGAAVKEALRLGYRHFDCAAVYGNEAEIGGALAEAFAQGQVTREELWITSKLWNTHHAPEDVGPALEKTLSDLQIEYLDLYLIHWPVAMKKDAAPPTTAEHFISLEDLPLSATWAAMEEQVDAGRCRHIGVSNFSAPKIRGILEVARHRPAMNQVEMHPYLQQPELLSFCTEEGIFMTAYSPLGSPGRPEGLRQEDDPILLQDPKIAAIAERLEVSPAQVLLAWAIHRGTGVIPKSVNPARLEQNLAAADVVLSAEDMAQIATLDRRRRYIDGRFWAPEGSPYSQASLWDE